MSAPVATNAGGTAVRASEVVSMAAAIRAALLRHGGNRTRAAADLGVHRITLLRRMRRLGLS